MVDGVGLKEGCSRFRQQQKRRRNVKNPCIVSGTSELKVGMTSAGVMSFIIRLLHRRYSSYKIGCILI